MNRLIRVYFLPLSAGLLFSQPAATLAQERWQDPAVFDINREPPHATYVPFANRGTAIAGDALASPYYLSLNGSWKYNWVKIPADRPRSFFNADFDDGSWEEIRVPSNWQLEGYGTPHYIEMGKLDQEAERTASLTPHVATAQPETHVARTAPRRTASPEAHAQQTVSAAPLPQQSVSAAPLTQRAGAPSHASAKRT